MAHWSGVCVECAGLLTQVPRPVLLGAVVATLTGLFVLVRCCIICIHMCVYVCG